MFDDMKTKGALKKINEGGTAELSKSQIVLSLVNLNAAFKPMKNESLTKKMPEENRKRVNAIMDWYKDLRADKTKETYDKAKLDEVSAQILAELKELQGPTQEEIEAETKANDEDVKQAEKIDLDNFFESDDDDDSEDSDESNDDDSEDSDDSDDDESDDSDDSDDSSDDSDDAEDAQDGDADK